MNTHMEERIVLDDVLDTLSSFFDNADGTSWAVSDVETVKGFLVAAEYRWLYQQLYTIGKTVDLELSIDGLNLEYLATTAGKKVLQLAKQSYAQEHHVSEAQARNKLLDAVALHHFGQKMLELLAAGEVSEQHVSIAAQQLRSLRLPKEFKNLSSEEQQDLEEEFHQAQMLLGEKLLETMKENPHVQDYKPAAQQQRDQTHPDSLARRCARAAQRRGVYFRTCTDGMARIEAFVPAQHAMILQQALEMAVRSHKAVGTARGRSSNQIKADVFTDLLLSHPQFKLILTQSQAHGECVENEAQEFSDLDDNGVGDVTLPAGVTVELLLNLNLEEFINLGGILEESLLEDLKTHYPELGHRAEENRRSLFDRKIADRVQKRVQECDSSLQGLGDDYNLSPQVCNALLKEASRLSLILKEPVSDHTIGTSRGKRYQPSEEMKWLVRLRDQRCRAPGCRISYYACETDHTQSWADQGESEYWNLGLLCLEHHRSKSQNILAVKSRPDLGDGAMEFKYIHQTGDSEITYPSQPLAAFRHRHHQILQKENETPPF